MNRENKKSVIWRKNKEKNIKKSDKNIVRKLRENSLSKKEEILLGALILGSSGLLGYYGFINGPVENRQALLEALQNSKTHVVQAKSGKAIGSKFSGNIYGEDQVRSAVESYVSNDPNVVISSENFEDINQNTGKVSLTIEHSGTSEELSQYLDTIAGADKSIIVDNISYQKDISGIETSIISIEIPYEIQDGSLKEQSFMGTNADLNMLTSPAPNGAPATTATPLKKLSPTRPSTSVNKFPKLRSISSLSKPSSATTNKITRPSSGSISTPSKKPSQSTKGPSESTNSPITKPVENSKPPVKEASKTPERKPDKINNAQPIVNYSILDTLESFDSMDGLTLEISSFDRNLSKNTPMEEEWIKIAFSTPKRVVSENPVQVKSELKEEGKDQSSERTEVEGEDQVQNSAPIEVKDGDKTSVTEALESQSSDKDLATDPAIQGEENSPAEEEKDPKALAQKVTPREIRLNTGGIYLPRNAYELSFDLQMPIKTKGNFKLLLANEKGEIQLVEENRRVDVAGGYCRIFFSLKNMDGSIRANQFRYNFLDKEEVSDVLTFRNFQILSVE